MIDRHGVFAPARRVAFRRIGDQMVLVSPDENVMLTLNPTGSLVWEGLDGKKSVAQIAAALEQEFAVSADQAQKDVISFLELMLDRALVEGVAVDGES